MKVFCFYISRKKTILLGTALIAAIIYRKYAQKNNDNDYYKIADEFENLAVEILDRFFEKDMNACTKAIIRQIPAYGNVTWLQLAVTARAKQFISHRAVQDVSSNIWYDCIQIKIEIIKKNFNLGLVILINEKVILKLYFQQ